MDPFCITVHMISRKYDPVLDAAFLLYHFADSLTLCLVFHFVSSAGFLQSAPVNSTKPA